MPRHQCTTVQRPSGLRASKAASWLRWTLDSVTGPCSHRADTADNAAKLSAPPWTSPFKT
eukprot:351773-Chlamydomonas_euryale.AAC.4